MAPRRPPAPETPPPPPTPPQNPIAGAGSSQGNGTINRSLITSGVFTSSQGETRFPNTIKRSLIGGGRTQ